MIDNLISSIVKLRFISAVVLVIICPLNPLLSAPATEITWEDLIPQGIPYAQIIGLGELDEINDTWLPEYDDNAFILNESLNDTYIKIPGFIVPIEHDPRGVTDFILVPYLGACIHTPPPPPNQLIYVTARDPWPHDSMWAAVWVTGILKTQFQSTDLGQTGYNISADEIEDYEW